MKDSFYKKQSNLTAAKIEIYEEYLKRYLPKIMMGFGKFFVADLFCGAGRNGSKKGSPLVLLEAIAYLLTSPEIESRNPKAYVLFNDKKKENVENLTKELKHFSNSFIEIFKPENKSFSDILPTIIGIARETELHEIPKFFFLDPFTYSVVEMKDLNNILNLKNSEVLLFLPVFHSYRFASDAKMKEDHKTRRFIEEFTINGVYDYRENEEGFDDFMQSLKDKLKKDLNLKYVRPLILNGGKCKNCLILLTRSRDGMLAMNKIAHRKSENGKELNVNSNGQSSLFGAGETIEFKNFFNKIELELRGKGIIDNNALVEIGIEDGFLPKHVKEVLVKLFQDGKIKVSNDNFEVRSKSQWNIAEKIKKTIYFHYKK